MENSREMTGIPKKVTAHTQWHGFVAHLVLKGVDEWSVCDLGVRTTRIYVPLARAMRGKS